jgi:hypothetical protein
MDEYNDRFILARRGNALAVRHQSYLQFEQESLSKKYADYLRKACDEWDMQSFFENNPVLLPGIYDLHHGPVGDVVISKLELAEEHESDFSFITVNGATAQITFVTIESPKLKIFRSPDNRFTSVFNGCMQKAHDRASWVQNNAVFIKERFRDIYFKDVFKNQRVVFRTIVVAGRRADICRNPQRQRQWAEIDSGPTMVMSYDRLGEWILLRPRSLQLICRPSQDVSLWLKSRR